MSKATEHGACHRKRRLLSRTCARRRARPLATYFSQLAKLFPPGRAAARGAPPQIAATTEISTRNFCCASLASTVARAGVLTGSTHASHAAFIWSYVFMSARYTVADSKFDLLVPADASSASIFFSTASVWAFVVGSSPAT